MLRKEGKHVSCDPKVLEMTKSLKNEFIESRPASLQQSADKKETSVYELKLKKEIDDLKA